MQRRNLLCFAVILPLLIACIMINSSMVFASSGILKEGMSGSQVTSLQRDLNTLGYLECNSYRLLWQSYNSSS